MTGVGLSKCFKDCWLVMFFSVVVAVVVSLVYIFLLGSLKAEGLGKALCSLSSAPARAGVSSTLVMSVLHLYSWFLQQRIKFAALNLWSNVKSVTKCKQHAMCALAGCRKRCSLWLPDCSVDLLALGCHSLIHVCRYPSDLEMIFKNALQDEASQWIVAFANDFNYAPEPLFLRPLMAVQSFRERGTWTMPKWWPTEKKRKSLPVQMPSQFQADSLPDFPWIPLDSLGVRI